MFCLVFACLHVVLAKRIPMQLNPPQGIPHHPNAPLAALTPTHPLAEQRTPNLPHYCLHRHNPPEVPQLTSTHPKVFLATLSNPKAPPTNTLRPNRPPDTLIYPKVPQGTPNNPKVPPCPPLLHSYNLLLCTRRCT